MVVPSEIVVLNIEEANNSLLNASFFGHLDSVQRLINVKGINLRVKDRIGWMPIHWAVWENHFEIAEALLLADPTLKEMKTEKGYFNGNQTPLILAAKKCQKQLSAIFILLLEFDASLEDRDQNGMNAISILRENGIDTNLVTLAIRSVYENRVAKLKSKKLNENQQKLSAKLKLLEGDTSFKQGVKEYRTNKTKGLTFLKQATTSYNEAFKLDKTLQSGTDNYKRAEEILSIPIGERQIDPVALKKEIKLHYVCAILSKHAYPTHKNPPEFFSGSNCKFEQLMDSVAIGSAGFKAGYFAKAFKVTIENDPFIIIAHCGTVETENGDLAADALLAFDLHHVQFPLATQFTEQVLKKISSEKVTIHHTGHSLGAALAEVTATEYGHDATTFESPGSYDLIAKTSHTIRAKNKVTTYLTTPNFINTLKPHLGLSYRLYMDQVNVGVDENVSKMATGMFNALAKLGGFDKTLKKLDQLKEPLVKIISRDVRLHGIDNIAETFERLVREGTLLTRRKEIMKWPIGPLQYFSLATLMIEEKEFEVDKLTERFSFVSLAAKKSIYYEVRTDSPNLATPQPPLLKSKL